MKPPDRLSPVPWALAFCLIALAITATGYLSYQSYRQHFRANQASQLSAIADLKVSELTSWRTERANNARVLVTNPEFAALVERFLTSSEDSESMRRLLAWLNVERQAYGYDRVYLTDLQGSPLLFSPIETLPDSSTAAAYIPDALRARQVVFVDFYRNTRQQIRLSLLAPVYAGLDPSRPLGIVVFDIDPQIDLYPYISRWPIPSDTAETLIIRKDGGDTLFLNNLRFNPTAALSLRVPLTKTNVPSVRAALGDTGSMEGSDYRGVAVLAELRTVPGSPWFLVARVDLTELYQPLNERLWQTLAFFGMLIIGSALGLGLVWRQQSLHFYRERYLTAQALEQSEARFRTLVEQAPTAILIQSGTRFTYVNQAGVHLFGAAQPQQITGQPAAERFLANAQARIQQHLDQLNEQPGVPAVLEESITRLDGSRREVELSAARVTINNEPAALVFLQDISQRKQAEALLKEYNARLEHEVQQRTLELQSAQEKLLRQEKLAVLGQLAGSIGHNCATRWG
ncbi:MAG: PAS domain S-box protein [Chloroflexota bacterium]